MDRIRLSEIRVEACHGVLEKEKRLPQWFRVEVQLFGDFSRAVRDDDLKHALDYSRVYELVMAEVRGRSFALIESLAGHLCGRILAEFEAFEVEITVVKENPPMEGFHGEASVTLRRSRTWLED